jgi:hypothetical protein
MGGASSSQSRRRHSVQGIREDPQCFGQYEGPHFRQEHILATYFHGSQSTSQDSVARVHSPSELAALLLGCYEQLDNIPQILETLIQGNQGDDNPLISALNHDVMNYVTFANVRRIMISTAVRFSREFVTLPHEKPTKKADVSITIKDVIEGFEYGFPDVRSSTRKTTVLRRLAEYFENATPACCFAPASPIYFTAEPGHFEVLNARFVYAHCIASNGQFLFVLCNDSWLQILPVMNMGGLLPAISRQLPATFDDRSSLIATKTHITIYTPFASHEYLISDVLANKFVPVVRPISSGFFCYCTDGILVARLDVDFTVSLSRDGKIIRKVRLQPGSAELHKAIPSLFPNTDYMLIPVEMNGSSIGFIFRMNPSTILFRVFSLITGKHISDIVFQCESQCYGAMVDSLNLCHWIVTVLENNRLGIKRFHYAGGINPILLDFSEKLKFKRGEKFSKFMKYMNKNFLHYVGSHFVPESFATDNFPNLERFFYLIKRYLAIPHDPVTIQLLITCINLSLHMFEPTAEIAELILDLVPQLPPNIAIFLFFGSLNWSLFGLTDKSLAAMISLFRKADVGLLPFALLKIESFIALARIPFFEENEFNRLIPSGRESDSSIGPHIQSLLMIHQRLLISYTSQFLEDFDEIQYLANTSEKTPLDYLHDYATHLISKFDQALKLRQSYEGMEESFTVKLLFNFLNLVSSISQHHVIAQILTKLFSDLLDTINLFINNKSMDITDDSRLSQIVRVFLFIYGKLATTLMKGGYLSDFERKFGWLISTNLEAPDDPNLLDGEVAEFADDRMNVFLEDSESHVMNPVYATWRPNMHRNLSPPIKAFDKLTLLTLAGHMRLLPELFDSKRSLHSDLKPLLEQMLRIRNVYRNRVQQNEDSEALRQKVIMLQKLKTKSGFSARDLADFILSDEDPQKIAALIRQQKVRSDLTALGFQVVERVFSMESHPLVTQIFAFTLEQISNFDGLASIMKITNIFSRKENFTSRLFGRFLQIIKSEPSTKLCLVCFWFFRDCYELVDSGKEFMARVLEFFCTERKDDKTLFALCLSLIHSLDKLPAALINDVKHSPMEWLLISAALTKIQCDKAFYRIFKPFFWVSGPNLERILCRVMFHILNSTRLGRGTVRSELKAIIRRIGENFTDYKDKGLAVANEMVWIIRRILVEKTPARPILLKIIHQTSRDDPIALCGLFAIFGGTLENIRPYCNIKYQENRSSSLDYIAVTTERADQFMCYARPFVLHEPAKFIWLSPTVLVYAVPLLVLSPDSYDNFDFILSFFTPCFENLASITSALYVQVLAHYLKFPEFIEKMTPDMIHQLSISSLPFHLIYSTRLIARQMQTLEPYPEVSGFSGIAYRPTAFASYLSPQLLPMASARITYKIESGDPVAYFGIVSDTVERYFTRYSLIGVPSGVWYPFNQKFPKFTDTTSVDFWVDVQAKEIRFADNAVQFPLGEKFRILIAAKKDSAISIEVNPPLQEICDAFGCPTICDHGATAIHGSSNLFITPPVVKQMKNIPRELDDFPNIRDMIEPVPTGYKVYSNFTEPPSLISIHPGFATHASPAIVSDWMRGLFRTLALQFATVCLMRIFKVKPELTINPTKLFTLMTIPLEPFSASSFASGLFPFTLTTPVWEHFNYLYFSFEIDAKECLKKLININILRLQLCRDLFKICENKYMHLITYPHINHTFYVSQSSSSFYKVKSRLAILAINSLSVTKPGLLSTYPSVLNSTKEVAVTPDLADQEVSIFNMADTDNSFAFDTAFEVLLLLKNLLFLVKSPEERRLLKLTFFDLLITHSPFVLRYLSDFADYIQLQMPPSPYDFSEDYRSRLIILGSILRQSDLKDQFRLFLLQESRVLESPLIMELTKFFPEFLAVEPGPPTSTTCRIPVVPIDPGAITQGFNEVIQTFKLFTRRYESLVGFPFWEILPYWLRVSEAWRTDKKTGNGDSSDEVEPFYERITPEVMRISNPTPQLATFRVRYTANHKWPPQSMMMMDILPEMGNAQFLNARQMNKTHDIEPQGTIFLGLIDVPEGWQAVRIEFTNYKKFAPPPPEEVTMSNVREPFLADMKEFATTWSDADTEELIILIPRYAFREPDFAGVEAVAKSSNLCQRFSTNVVLLRSLVLHHFNFIRWKHYTAVSRALWDSMTSFVSCEDAADLVTSEIVNGPPDSFASFTIDRHAAHQLVLAGRGDSSKSVISQLSSVFRKIGVSHLQCKKRPWKVKFLGEYAIDAGGPTRELMTETASSIFEATSKLAIPTPNNRRQVGQFRDTFIPFDKVNRRTDDFKAIGNFLGVVLRTGFSQDLPFAPLVWRYFANEPIRREDILSIDDMLRDHFRHLTEECQTANFEDRIMAQWVVETWDGNVQTLPGHSPGGVVKGIELEQYFDECIQFRIMSVRPFLSIIRKAFRENIGFKKHPLLTGALLSRMAQGSSVITAMQLKSITVYADYDGPSDQYITRFWRAVDRFNSEQTKLLMKFITTLTRLPNPSINPEFKIQIDRMNARSPDQSLPTASTCFNRLHLPMYTDDEICYQKLLYAIQFCQTMENK